MPLHPALVHLPIAFALLTPLLLLWALRRRGAADGAAAVYRFPIALQALVVLSAGAAMATGDGEEHQVRRAYDASLAELSVAPKQRPGLAQSEPDSPALRRLEGERQDALAQIEKHEQRAFGFLVTSAVALAGAIAALALKERRRAAAAAGWTAAVASVCAAGLGLAAGKAGGELVYRVGVMGVRLETRAPEALDVPPPRNNED